MSAEHDFLLEPAIRGKRLDLPGEPIEIAAGLFRYGRKQNMATSPPNDMVWITTDKGYEFEVSADELAANSRRLP